MIKKLIAQMKQLSLEKRHMMTLFWIQTFASSVTGLFVNVFVFLETESIVSLILYSMVFHIALFIGFVGIGYLFSYIQKSLKFAYLDSFGLLFISFVWIAIITPSFQNLLIFGLINGIGSGLFWLTNHSYEMIYTKNEDGDRDFYSSIEHAGSQVVRVLAIVIGTVLIFLAERVFNVDTFSILFWFLPLVFMVSLPFLFSLPDYLPEKVSCKKMFAFLKIKKKQKIALYYIFSNEQVAGIAVTLFSVIALESALRIGTWESIVGIIVFITTLALANIRRATNRLRIMKYALVGYVIVYSLLFFSDISVYFYLAFSLLIIFLRPIYRISQHTIDLHSIDLIAGESKKTFSGLLARDTILVCSRTFNLGIALILALVLHNNILTGKILIIFYLVVTIINWFIARRMSQN